MAAALGGDPQAALRGEPDDRDDVVDGLRERDRGGPLVDGEIPREASLVVAAIVREDDQAAQLVAGVAD